MSRYVARLINVDRDALASWAGWGVVFTANGDEVLVQLGMPRRAGRRWRTTKISRRDS